MLALGECVFGAVMALGQAKALEVFLLERKRVPWIESSALVGSVAELDGLALEFCHLSVIFSSWCAWWLQFVKLVRLKMTKVLSLATCGAVRELFVMESHVSSVKAVLSLPIGIQ